MFNMSLEVISLIEEYNRRTDRGLHRSRLALADSIINRLTIAIKEEEEYYERMAREYEEREWGRAEIESAVTEKELQNSGSSRSPQWGLLAPISLLTVQGE